MRLRSHFLTFLPLHAINIHHPFPVFFLSNAQFISDSVRPSKIPESKILMKIRRRSLDTWRMARSQFDKPFLKTRVLKTLTNVYFRAQKHFYRSFSCFGGRTNSSNICILLLCWSLVRVNVRETKENSKQYLLTICLYVNKERHLKSFVSCS